MAITEKKPSTKYTVGAQYICFNTDDDWDASDFESAVTKLPTVVDISVTDNSNSYESYASGIVYESDTIVTYKEISVTQLAFEEESLARQSIPASSCPEALRSGLTSRMAYRLSRRTRRWTCGGSRSASSWTIRIRRLRLRIPTLIRLTP